MPICINLIFFIGWIVFITFIFLFLNLIQNILGIKFWCGIDFSFVASAFWFSIGNIQFWNSFLLILIEQQRLKVRVIMNIFLENTFSYRIEINIGYCKIVRWANLCQSQLLPLRTYFLKFIEFNYAWCSKICLCYCVSFITLHFKWTILIFKWDFLIRV